MQVTVTDIVEISIQFNKKILSLTFQVFCKPEANDELYLRTSHKKLTVLLGIQIINKVMEMQSGNCSNGGVLNLG